MHARHSTSLQSPWGASCFSLPLVFGLMSSDMSITQSFGPSRFDDKVDTKLKLCAGLDFSACSSSSAYKDLVRCRKMVHFSLSICSLGSRLSFSPALRSFSATISTSILFTPAMSLASYTGSPFFLPPSIPG